jgi:hypothetical protein
MITLGGSPETLKKALEDYNAAWKAFLVVRHLETLEHTAVPNTISWKVADKADLFAVLESLKTDAEQMHVGTVNDRLIASVVLHKPYDGMSIVKILERRPGSDDPLGLDSLDYMVKDPEHTYELLKDAEAHIVKESNEVHDWLSLRFGKNLEFEAKFVDHLVLAVAIKEMEIAQTKLLKQYA